MRDALPVLSLPCNRAGFLLEMILDFLEIVVDKTGGWSKIGLGLEFNFKFWETRQLPEYKTIKETPLTSVVPLPLIANIEVFCIYRVYIPVLSMLAVEDDRRLLRMTQKDKQNLPVLSDALT